jgi:hypothetical protein
LEVCDVVPEIHFALIGTETLDSEVSLVFDERLPGFEVLEDGFRRFIGDGIGPIIAGEVVGECKEVRTLPLDVAVIGPQISE